MLFRLILISALGSFAGPLLADSKTPIDHVKPSVESIPPERREMLSTVAEAIFESIEEDGHAKVTFICTHNSRRSQFSQIWLHAAAEQFGLGGKIQAFSGGTEATACNPRTVAALKRVGFDFDVKNADSNNPAYRVTVPKTERLITLVSKVYDESPNPSSNFIAVMCCGDADKKCPVVFGSEVRIPLLYDDPKVSDGTLTEQKVYDERCRQIGSEMLFIVTQVAKELKAAKKASSVQ